MIFKKFGEFQPTKLDAIGLGSEGKEDWFVMPIGQNRDSNTIQRSNFTVMQKHFSEKDEEQESYEIHRFRHWGNGWFEILVFNPKNSSLLELAQDLKNELELHIVLDEDHWLQLEIENGNDFEEEDTDGNDI